MEILIYGTFLALSLVAYAARQIASTGDEKKINVSNINFKSFQKSFFLVYFLALLGDWLQGPYVYKLYAFYGFKESQIAVLYVAGFASSVIFGTCTGPLADIWGRRKMAISFAVIYTFCCLTKLSPNFWWLFVGRIFGGVATSMLFSTFESWYVYEHSERHGFPSEWIGITFSVTTFWNGIIAIIAGIISNVTAESLGYGPVAPFVVALLPLVVCGVLVVNTWQENYGDRKNNFSGSCMEGLRIIFSDSQVLLLGSCQSLLESCMYIFVFLWTPVLDTGNTPLGMVFSCFMVCIMVGSALFHPQQPRLLRGAYSEDVPDDNVCQHGRVLCHSKTGSHISGHHHLLPGLPPAGGRHRNVLPCHLLPPQSGHPGVPSCECHELVQGPHERDDVRSPAVPARGDHLPGQEDCVRSLLRSLHYRNLLEPEVSADISRRSGKQETK